MINKINDQRLEKALNKVYKYYIHEASIVEPQVFRGRASAISPFKSKWKALIDFIYEMKI